MTDTRSPGSTPSQLATFSVGNMSFGVDVQRVQEIIRYQEMTPVPLSSNVISGLINLRGQIITAIDLRKRLGIRPRSEEKLPMNVVLRTNDGVVSLLVDEIGDVIEVQSSQFEDTPETVSEAHRKLIDGVFKLEKKLLLILNTEEAVNVKSELSDRSNDQDKKENYAN